MNISLTSFVDFATKSGMAQITKTREILKQEQEGYAPYSDFYKKVREGIISYHQSGGGDKKQLDGLCRNLSDERKRLHFEAIVKGYKRFLGRKEIEWFDPPSSPWTVGNLTVRVNPELGLVLKGRPTVVKLYLSSGEFGGHNTQLLNSPAIPSNPSILIA
jgi:hypothetical protein